MKTIDLGLISLFCVASFILLVCLFLIIWDRKRSADWFSPLKIFSYFSLIEVPGLFFVSFNKDILSPLVLRSEFVKDFETTVAYTSLLILISFLFTIFGIINKSNLLIMKFFLFQRKLHPSKNTASSRPIVVIFIGLILWFYYIEKLGGISFVSQHLSKRVILMSGNAYFFNLWRYLIQISVILFVFSTLKKEYSFFKSIALYFFVSFCFLILISMGGRGPGIFLIWLMVLLFNYFSRPINPFKPKMLLIVLLLIIFSLFWGTVRIQKTPLAIDTYDKAFFQQMFNNAKRVLVHYSSGLESKILVTGYVSEKGIWYGASYKDLFKAPIPRSFFPNKPPVDDGKYIHAILLGKTVVPPMRLEELGDSSSPIGNWMGFINWGLPGLIILSFLTGQFIKASYEAFLTSKKHFLMFFFYAFVSKSLAFSGGAIVAFLVYIIYLHIVFYLVRFFNFIRILENCIKYIAEDAKS